MYAVPLAGGDLRRITQSPGMHTVAVSPRFDVFVDVTSSTTEPVSADIRALAGRLLCCCVVLCCCALLLCSAVVLCCAVMLCVVLLLNW